METIVHHFNHLGSPRTKNPFGDNVRHCVLSNPPQIEVSQYSQRADNDLPDLFGAKRIHKSLKDNYKGRNKRSKLRSMCPTSQRD